MASVEGSGVRMLPWSARCAFERGPSLFWRGRRAKGFKDGRRGMSFGGARERFAGEIFAEGMRRSAFPVCGCVARERRGRGVAREVVWQALCSM